MQSSDTPLCPPDPSLHRKHLVEVLSPSLDADVLDLTEHLKQGAYIGQGGFGQVYQGRWVNVSTPLTENPHSLPQVAIKVMRVPAQNDTKENKRCAKVSG